MILAKGFLLPAKGAVQWCRHFVRRRLSCRAVVVLLEIGYCFNLAINKLKSGYGKPQKKADSQLTANQPFLFFKVAGWTRLELATSCVTGRRSNQLNYHPLNFESQFRHIMLCLSICFFCGAYFFSIPINQSLLSKVHVLKYPSNRQNFPNFALWWFLSFRENFMFDISAPKNT